MNATDYRKQLELLLPSGSAIDPQSGSVLLNLLGGFAEELARIEGRGRDLIDEADPRTTTELLAEWLAIVGVPDECAAHSTATIGEREQLLQKLIKQSGQTPLFYQEMAEVLGYSASVEEFPSFNIDQGAIGDPLTDGSWTHCFTVRINGVTDYATAGEARASDRLGYFDASFLYCLLQKAKPAQTVAFVGFE